MTARRPLPRLVRSVGIVVVPSISATGAQRRQSREAPGARRGAAG